MMRVKEESDLLLGFLLGEQRGRVGFKKMGENIPTDGGRSRGGRYKTGQSD